jgi:hypothetical protein
MIKLDISLNSFKRVMSNPYLPTMQAARPFVFLGFGLKIRIQCLKRLILHIPSKVRNNFSIYTTVTIDLLKDSIQYFHITTIHIYLQIVHHLAELD